MSYHAHITEDQIRDIAGRMSDKDAAELLNVARSAIAYHRKKLGIPPFKAKPTGFWEKKVDWTQTHRHIAETHGQKLTTVRAMRKRRGHPPPKTETEGRSIHVFRVRLVNGTHQKLLKIADAACITPSEWMRRKINEEHAKA